MSASTATSRPSHVAPLVPSDLQLRKAVPHACWAALRAAMQGGSAGEQCARMYPNDKVALALLQTRAAISGGSTTVSGWASQLIDKAVSDWLASLAPASAAATLMARGLTIPISGEGSISIPGRSGLPVAAPFVGEQSPIPVRQFVLGAATLTPRKVGTIVAWSRELSLSSADQVFETMLREDASVSLDSALLGTQAGSASAHGGLLNGVTPIAAGSAVMANDLSALAHAVGAGGSGEVVFIAGPGRAAAMAVRMPAEATAEVLASVAVPETRLIAIDAPSLLFGFAPAPDILASDAATVVMQDTPTDIGTPGAPAVVAAPTVSMFQTAQLAMRMLLDMAWATRRSGAIGYIDTGMTW
jgi:hypothetical protein